MSLAGRIISSIGVPLFWMISGALLLSKKRTMGESVQKKTPRMTGVLVIFSVARYFYLCMVGGQNGYVGEFFRHLYTQEIYTACKARHIKRIEGKAYRENSYRRIGL